MSRHLETALRAMEVAGKNFTKLGSLSCPALEEFPSFGRFLKVFRVCPELVCEELDPRSGLPTLRKRHLPSIELKIVELERSLSDSQLKLVCLNLAAGSVLGFVHVAYVLKRCLDGDTSLSRLYLNDGYNNLFLIRDFDFRLWITCLRFDLVTKTWRIGWKNFGVNSANSVDMGVPGSLLFL